MTVYAAVCAKSNMHLCWLISIDAGNVCDTDGTHERESREEIGRERERTMPGKTCKEKESFRVLVCKIINLFLGDPHLSSFDGGRGAPVGSMIEMEKEEREEEEEAEGKASERDSLTFRFASFRYST